MTKTFFIVATVAAFSTASASAVTVSDFFSSFYVLGDSNSDFGNFGADGPPPPYFNGQFSNGPVWADLVDDQFQTGDPDDIRTWNYAFGGARVTETSDIPDLPTQLEVFAADLDPDLSDPLPGTPVLGGRPLVSIWFGANDIRSIYTDYVAAIDGTDGLAAEQRMTEIVAQQQLAREQASYIGALYGASIASLAQVPEIGDLLSFTTADAGLTPEYDETADRALLSELSTLFNDALGMSLSDVEASGTNVYSIDIFQLQREITADPLAFGFENATDPCLTFDLNGAVLCDTPESYLYWDEVGHLSGAAHAALAGIVEQSVLAQLAAEEPPLAPVPLPATFPALAAGFGLLAGLRVRRKHVVI